MCYGVFSESFGLDNTIMKPIIGLSNMHQYIDLLYPICLSVPIYLAIKYVSPKWRATAINQMKFIFMFFSITNLLSFWSVPNDVHFAVRSIS